jgi:hypothetical protein
MFPSSLMHSPGPREQVVLCRVSKVHCPAYIRWFGPGLKESMKTILIVLAAAVLVLAGVLYAARSTQTIRDWHPVFAPVLDSLGFPGHKGHSHEHPARGGAFTDGAPVTSCWNYDFWQFELDCDGPDHLKAFVADGVKPDSRIGAYKGDASPIVYPLRAKACGMNAGHRYCVSDYVDDGRVVWRETHHNLEEHTLRIGCPGPRFELPCRSRDP